MPSGVYQRKINKFCSKGHDLSVSGKDNTGWCTVCRTEYEKEYNQLRIERLHNLLQENTFVVCSVCHLPKKSEEFAKDSLYCKDCKKGIDKKWRNTKHGKIIKKANKFFARYGISLQEYEKMFEEQLGCCAICGRNQSEFKRALSVDHDHKTGKIRGLLCNGCNNRVLSVVENASNLIEKARIYLEKYSEVKI
jgi:hypothetical protein